MHPFVKTKKCIYGVFLWSLIIHGRQPTYQTTHIIFLLVASAPAPADADKILRNLIQRSWRGQTWPIHSIFEKFQAISYNSLSLFIPRYEYRGLPAFVLSDEALVKSKAINLLSPSATAGLPADAVGHSLWRRTKLKRKRAHQSEQNIPGSRPS